MNYVRKIGLAVLIYSFLCIGILGLGVLFLVGLSYALSSGPQLAEVFGELFEPIILIGVILGLGAFVLLVTSSIGFFQNWKWATSCLSWGLYMAYFFSICLFYVCYKTAVFTKSYFSLFSLPPFMVVVFGLIIHKKILKEIHFNKIPPI